MPSASRRQLLHASGATLLALAGCTAISDTSGTDTTTPTTSPRPTPSATGTFADAPDGPEQYPARPPDSTREAALEYARAFEHARTTNSLHEPDVEALSVDARAEHDRVAHDGHYVLASSTGYANYADGVHADWGQAPALYFVSPTLVVRVQDVEDHYFHCTDVFAADNADENFAEVCEGGDAGYRAYNVHPDPHALSVTVEFLGRDGEATDPTTVLERTYELSRAAGAQQGSVTYRRGVYRLSASLADGPSTTYRWDLRSAPSYSTPPVTMLVTPVEGLTARRVPFPDLH